MSSARIQQASPLFATRKDEHSAVLSLTADLVQPGASEVRAALLDLLGSRPKRLLVDLTQVQAVDEAGLGTLLVVALWARKFSVEFALIPSPITRGRLTTAHLDGYLTLVEH